MRIVATICAWMLATSATAQIRPLPDSTFLVPKTLLADYINMTERVVPALQAVIVECRFVVHQDSIIMARQQEQLAMMERQLMDSERKGELFEAEIEKRKEIQELQEGEIRRLLWWRRAALAVGAAAITIAVLK